jgi:hypothetical protein
MRPVLCCVRTSSTGKATFSAVTHKEKIMRAHIVRSILVLAAAACSLAWAQAVKITPLGSHAGELCMRDRATIFEDPTGLRILYDADNR